MNEDFDVEEFVRQFACPQPARARKPAAEIMMAPVPTRVGPRVDRTASGRKRWVTLLDRKPRLKSFDRTLPGM